MIAGWFGEFKGLNYYASSNNLICSGLVLSFQVESSFDILCCYFGACRLAIRCSSSEAFTAHFCVVPVPVLIPQAADAHWLSSLNWVHFSRSMGLG